MIANAKEYAISTASVSELEQSLFENLQRDENPADARVWLERKLIRRGIERVLCDRYHQLLEYETRNGHTENKREVDLGRDLIRARVRSGMTQDMLAQQLGISENDIRRMEAASYADITLDMAQRIALAAGMRIRIEHANRATDVHEAQVIA